MPLEESPRLPERGRKIGKEMIIRPSKRILSTDIRSILLHSVRLDVSRRTTDEPRTQSKIHYFLFIQLASILSKPFIPFLSRNEMKGWSDPPSHRLPDHIELQTDLTV